MKDYKDLVTGLGGLVVLIFTVAANLTKLISDPQLLRYVIILAYIIFAGGIIWFAFKNAHASSKQRLSSLTFLCLVTVPFFILWVGDWTAPDTLNPCAEYGITITDPANGYTLVNGGVTVQGRFTKRPPAKSIQLIGIGGEQFWPQNINTVEVTDTGWVGKSFGEDGYRLLVTYVGENGRILFDYFQKAGNESGNFPGLDTLPADVFECASTFIPAP